MKWLSLLVWLWPALALGQNTDQAPMPRYAEAMLSELNALGLHPDCVRPSATSYACSYPARASLEPIDRIAHAHYDDTTDTIYLYVPLLNLDETSPRLPVVLRRAMELNWELLAAKLEWSSASGELRLSATLHTDSNFDRRAFRSLVRALDHLCLRYSAELAALAAP